MYLFISFLFVVPYVYLFISFVLVVPYVYLLYLMCISCTLYVFVVPYVHLLYYVCIAILTLDAGLLAISQYPSTSTQVFLGFPVSTSEC